jgi:surface antigen
MLTKCARTSAALVLIASAGAFALAGCEAIEKETGLLAGAAVGGIIAALADANPAWIAASTVLGGVAGGAIGDYLGRKDAEKHAQNNLNALDTLGQGQTSSWSDTETGNSGSTTVTSVTTKADGTVCKSFTEMVRTSAKTVTEQATACKAPGGTWKVQTA